MSTTLGKPDPAAAEEARLARHLANFRTTPPTVMGWKAPINPKPLTLPPASGPLPAVPLPPAPATGPKSAQALRGDLDARRDARATLQAPTDAIRPEVEKLAGGADLLAALGAFRAVPADAKNGAAAHAAVQQIVAQCDRWLGQNLTADAKPDVGAVAQVAKARKAAMAEQQKLTAIRQAVATLSTPSPDFATTGEWNTSGSVRIKTAANMNGGPPDKASAERAVDSKRQIEKFLAILDREASRSDAFAALVADSVNAPGGSFDMFFGKGAAGAFDDYGNLGVDADDLDSLPADPRAVGSTKGGVTKGEIVAHVLEERMYGMQGGGDKLPYADAHQRCLSPGSYQNQHRRELGIPADSILYDNCQHAHTEAGCACFEALDTQGVKTIVHDIPTDRKANKPLGTPGTAAPDESATEVAQTFPGTAKQNIDALVADALVKAKANMYGQVRDRRSNPVADPFDWPTPQNPRADTQEVAHFVGIAEAGDATLVAARKDAIKAEMDAYKRNVENGATLSPDLEKAKSRADQWRTLGTSPEEQFIAAQRAQRPPVVNTGTKADGATNCALCTTGAILNTTTADACASVQRKLGVARPDTTMQGPNLFMNAALGIDDSLEPDARKAKLKTLPADYLKEVATRYRLADTSQPDWLAAVESDGGFWNRLEKKIAGDFQFEGVRTMLEGGVAARNAKGGPQYEVVQDGLPDEDADGGKMYPWAELVSRMEQYADGTQFQVFVDGALQHWISADKVRGKVIFEDLQKNVTVTKQKQAAVAVPKSAVDAERDHAALWADEAARYRRGQNMEADEPLNPIATGRVLAAVQKTLRAGATTTEEFTVPNSAYIASATDKPHHPQHDDRADVFQRGMFLAVAPKNAPKPGGRFEKQIGPAAAKLAPLAAA